MKLTVKNTQGNPQGEFDVQFDLIENGKGTQAVHDAVVAAAPVGPGGFVDGQRIHVGPQADATPLRIAPAPYHRHQTGAAEAAVHLIDPAAGELTRHQLSRDMLLEAEFGVAVQLVPDLGQVAMMLAQPQQRGVGAKIGFGGVHD